MENVLSTFNELMSYLGNKYHDDEELKSMLMKHEKSIRSLTTTEPESHHGVLHNQRTANDNCSRQDKSERVKSLLKESVAETVLIEEETCCLRCSNTSECVSSIKMLASCLLTNGNRQLQYYIILGYVIGKLKTFRHLTYRKVLKANGVNYGDRYLSFLIQLHELAVQYPVVRQFTVSISFIKTNFVTIRRIFYEGLW